MIKSVLIIASCLAVVIARPEPPTNYGTPEYSAPVASYGAPSTEYGVAGGQVFRHIYIHQAPDEGVDQQSRTIRVPGGGDKHVNIIFVKTPSQSSNHQTEVILPEQGEQKNIVYVLVKKGEHSSDVKIRQNPQSAPQKPEVYFIRYKNKESGGHPYEYGSPAPAPSGGY